LEQEASPVVGGQHRSDEGEHGLGADLKDGKPEEAEDNARKAEPTGSGGLKCVQAWQPDEEDQAPEQLGQVIDRYERVAGRQCRKATTKLRSVIG
jgi:hypothetical protein